MQGLIIVATLVALVASIVVINSRQKPIIMPNRHKPAIKRQPINIRMMKRRYLKRQQQRDQQHEQQYHTKEQQWLMLLATLAYHHYRHEQATLSYN